MDPLSHDSPAQFFWFPCLYRYSPLCSSANCTARARRIWLINCDLMLVKALVCCPDPSHLASPDRAVWTLARRAFALQCGQPGAPKWLATGKWLLMPWEWGHNCHPPRLQGKQPSPHPFMPIPGHSRGSFNLRSCFWGGWMQPRAVLRVGDRVKLPMGIFPVCHPLLSALLLLYYVSCFGYCMGKVSYKFKVKGRVLNLLLSQKTKITWGLPDRN